MGCIIYKIEFVAAAMEKSMYLREDKLLDAFKVFDKDRNGKITAEELKDILGSMKGFFEFFLIFLGDPVFHQNPEYFESMIKEADLNGDGEVILFY